MLLSAFLAAALTAGADSVLLRLLAINDFHGALDAQVYGWSDRRPVGGAAALKATMDSAAAACRCPVLRLDAGDQMQGSLGSNLLHGRSTVEALNLLGLDAAAVGNHELDWGVDTLKARMAEARYPWLAANVFDSATGRRPAWARPWAMLRAGRYRVAAIGYGFPGTKSIVMAAHVAGLDFRRGPAALSDVLAEVGAARPDVTVLLAHEGAFCDFLACRGAIVDLAWQLDSTVVQLIVSGHTHSLVNSEVNGIPIVQARSNGTALGIADLVLRPDGSRVWRVRVETVWADVVTPDPGIQAVVNRHRPAVDRVASRVVGTLGDSLLRPRGVEYPLGNLIADAQRHAGERRPVDAALMNNGGIRRDLYPGPLTYGDLFELQPFANQVVQVTLSGAQLTQVLEHALADSANPDAHVSGLVVRYDSRRPAGGRVVELLLPDGSPVRPERFYVLAVSDYLAGGGNGYTMLRALPTRRTGMTDLEALIAWIGRQPRPLAGPRDRRLIDLAP